MSNPLRSKAIALSKHKSDRVDAEALAQLLRCGYLPKVWIADPHTRQERNLAARRSALVRQGALIKNRVHSILHQHLIQAPFDPFTQQVASGSHSCLWPRTCGRKSPPSCVCSMH